MEAASCVGLISAAAIGESRSEALAKPWHRGTSPFPLRFSRHIVPC